MADVAMCTRCGGAFNPATKCPHPHALVEMAHTPTVRELVREIQTELRTTDVTPSRAAELLVKLTALMGNCLEEIRNADHAYALVLLEHLEADTAANRAKIRAETTEQYLWKRETRDTKEIVVEMSRSLKYLLRSQAEEMRLTR